MPDPTTATDPVADAFAALIRALAADALARSDAGDDAGFDRGTAYRTAVRGMADRWASGEASPVRRAPKQPAAEG